MELIGYIIAGIIGFGLGLIFAFIISTMGGGDSLDI